MYKTNIHAKDSIWFLMGSKTEVKVLRGDIGGSSLDSRNRSEVEVIKLSQTSKYRIGDVFIISNRCLYPRQERKGR